MQALPPTISSIAKRPARVAPSVLLAAFAASSCGQGAVEVAGDPEEVWAVADALAAAGQSDSALVEYRRLLTLLTPEDDDWAALLDTIGRIHHYSGRLDSALEFFSNGLEHGYATGDAFVVGDAYHNLAATYRALGRPDSSFHLYDRAAAVGREVGDSIGVAITLNAIGALHEELGTLHADTASYSRAVAAYRGALVALDEYEAIAYDSVDLRNAWVLRGDAYSGIGVTHRRLARPDSALVYYREAERIQAEVAESRGLAMTTLNIGLVYRDLVRNDSARVHLDEALERWRNRGEPRWEAETLYELGILYHRWAGAPDPATGVAYYDSAMALFSALRAGAGSDANRLGIRDKATFRGLFDDRTLALAASDTPLQALLGAEAGRALALLDLRGLGAETEDPDRQATSLVEAIEDVATTTVVYLSTADTLLTWLVRPNSDVMMFRTPVSRDTLAALVAGARGALGVDDAATRSALSDDPAEEFEFVPTRSSRRRESTDTAWPTEEATTLTELLFPPGLRSALPEEGDILIVPHGSLNLLPFAALELDGLPLGLRNALRYTPSLALLGQSAAPDSPPERSASVVVGDPAMPVVPGLQGEVRLSQLSGADAEGRDVAERLGVGLLTDAAASEGAVRALLGDASIVHLATHGFAYGTDARVRDSWVALAPSDGHDGLLTVAEILDDLPPLRASLVVLSACQTGLGSLKQAEGTVGLQRAFLARGAGAVLVSLWSVSDAATRTLMSRFYDHWLDGPDTPGMAEALRRAQADLVAAGSAHPSLWAAFQLVGDA